MCSSDLKLFPSYIKGAHLEIPGIDEIITVKKCTGLKLYPKAQNFFLCADGEIQIAEEVEFSVVPEGMRFVVPANMDYGDEYDGLKR